MLVPSSTVQTSTLSSTTILVPASVLATDRPAEVEQGCNTEEQEMQQRLERVLQMTSQATTTLAMWTQRLSMGPDQQTVQRVDDVFQQIKTEQAELQKAMINFEKELNKSKQAMIASSTIHSFSDEVIKQYHDLAEYRGGMENELHPLKLMASTEIFEVLRLAHSNQSPLIKQIETELEKRINNFSLKLLIEVWNELNKIDSQLIHSLKQYFSSRARSLIYQAARQDGSRGVEAVVKKMRDLEIPFTFGGLEFGGMYHWMSLHTFEGLPIDKLIFTNYDHSKDHFDNLEKFSYLEEIQFGQSIKSSEFELILGITSCLKKLGICSPCLYDSALSFATKLQEYLVSISIGYPLGYDGPRRITNEGINTLLQQEKLSRIESVDLPIDSIDSNLMMTLASLKSLRYLRLQCKEAITRDVVTDLNLLASDETRSVFPLLETFEIWGDQKVTSTLLQELHFLLGVTNLTLGECPRVTGEFLKYLGQQKSLKLKKLNLLYNDRISKKNYTDLLEVMPGLEITFKE